MKHKMTLLLAVLPLLLCAGLLLLRPEQEEAGIPAADEAVRLAWLESQGLSCEPVSSAGVTIPLHMDGTYASYAALQQALGLPLAAHSGESGMLYTYYVKGSDPPLYAELLTADGILIGAQCYFPHDSITRDLQGEAVTG